jgi:hypothetical protein
MAAPKARAAKTAAAEPKADLAEARRRAKAAKTPIAKIVTRQVVEKKERAYSGQAAKDAARGTAARAATGKPAAAATPRRTPARRRSA